MTTTARFGSRERRHSRVAPLRVEGLESRQLLANATLSLATVPPPATAGTANNVALNGYLLYTFSITNPSGPNAPGAATVTFNDTLPATLKFLSAVSSTGTLTTQTTGGATTITVTGIHIAENAPAATITIQALPTSTTPGTVTNLGTITSANPNEIAVGSISQDSNVKTTGDNLTVQTLVAPNPVLLASGSTATPAVDYTFIVTNNGTTTATNVTLTANQIPSQVTVQSLVITTATGTTTATSFPPTGINLGTLATGASARVLVVTSLKAGTPSPSNLGPFVVTVLSDNPPLNVAITPNPLLNAPIIPPTVAVAPPPAPLNVPPTVTQLNRYGIHRQPTSIVIGFSEPMKIDTVQNRANYQVTLVGASDRHGAGRRRACRSSRPSTTGSPSRSRSPSRRPSPRPARRSASSSTARPRPVWPASMAFSWTARATACRAAISSASSKARGRASSAPRMPEAAPPRGD